MTGGAFIASPPVPAWQRGRAVRGCARRRGSQPSMPAAAKMARACRCGARAGAKLSSVVSRMAAVEAGELAHEVVEALVRLREGAQHDEDEQRRAARPEEQGEMREVA